MTKNYKYIPELPHNTDWSIGQKVNNCLINGKEYTGPNRGEEIELINLPYISGKKNVFIRFWASKDINPKKSYKEAYGELDSTYEKMPDLSYYNGGIVKVTSNGKVNFKLIIPKGYTDKKLGMLIPPHFHYRLCINNYMGPVHTQFFE